MQPLEMITPVLREPYLPGKKPLLLELLPKLKSILMASYFGFDHVVWLGSAGIVKDKQTVERCGAATPPACIGAERRVPNASACFRAGMLRAHILATHCAIVPMRCKHALVWT